MSSFVHRKIVLLTGCLTLTGGLLRMLATLPGLNDQLDEDVQYLVSLVAQLVIGVANPLAFCLPTKVAVDWFPESEAPRASGAITMSFVLGMALSTGLSPILFSDEDLIPWMNVAYFFPCLAAFLCSVLLVKSDRPPTPPTHSAFVEARTHPPYLKKSVILGLHIWSRSRFCFLKFFL